MELVDMRGLKPRPLKGPGSIPGMGTWIKLPPSMNLLPYCIYLAHILAPTYLIPF